VNNPESKSPVEESSVNLGKADIIFDLRKILLEKLVRPLVTTHMSPVWGTCGVPAANDFHQAL